MVHRPAFTARDDPARCENRQRQSARRGRAVKGDRGVNKCAGVSHHAVDDLQFPIADRALAPEVCGHERPVEIGTGVIEPGSGEARAYAAGGRQPPFEIAAIRVRGYDVNGDVFEAKVIGRSDGEGVSETVVVKIRHREIVHVAAIVVAVCASTRPAP
jgi:hypothetical protein